MTKEMKYAGTLVNLLLNDLCERVTIGNTGNELNAYAEEALHWFEPKAILACKNFHGFPKSICVSVNSAIIHGIPNNIPFKEDDVVKIDLVIKFGKYFADSARTVICGKGREEDIRLVKTCKECLYKAISVARRGWTIGDIGHSIQQHAERQGYSVMRDFSGHFIGKSIHLPPQIPCFGKQREGYRLKEDDLLCIEPMLFMGNSRIVKGENGWVVRSADGMRTSHWEHTIEIQRNGIPIIIT